ncbi:peptidase M16 [Alphaproteobacteria bacterium]|nr:peptidase M16 [Alphaproteobacteria bacterium]
MNPFKFILSTVIVLLGFCSCEKESGKQESTALKSEMPEIKRLFGSQTKTLSNGLQIVVVEEHSVPRVSMSVLYKVGAADDPAHIMGVSHMLEHLFFYGSSKYPDFTRAVGKLGGVAEAYTDYDCTVFNIDCPVEKLGVAFAMEADRMANFCLKDDQVFEREKKVIHEERLTRVENSMHGLLHEFIQNAISPQHPYGKLVIGQPHTLLAISKDDVMAHYKKWYKPHNAVLIVVGDVKAEGVFGEAERAFGGIPSEDASASSLERVRVKNSMTENVHQKIQCTWANIESARVVLCYNTPHFKKDGKRKCFALLLGLRALLEPSCDFYTYFEDKKFISNLTFFCGFAAFDPELLRIQVDLPKTITPKVFLKEFFAKIEQILKNGVKPEDFAREKKLYLINVAYKETDGHRKICDCFTCLARGDTVEGVEASCEDLLSVTEEQANAALKEFLGKKPRALVKMSPESER